MKHRRRGTGWAGALLLATAALAAGAATAQGAAQGVPRTPGHWVVDPRTPGPDLPPTGRSAFDLLVLERADGAARYDIPYPFAALVDKIEAHLQPTSEVQTPLKRVLVPLGRSLQRAAAAPDFYRYPRVVVAADTEPAASSGRHSLLLKDRLFIGYQEKARVLEVISYNEQAARFEFQLVRDYGPGGREAGVSVERLHDLGSDGEAVDLAGANPDLLGQLLEQLEARRAAADEAAAELPEDRGAVSAATKDQLGDLGYL